ncbi:hypothetical protein CISIN_1g042551mg, partial [Citrus sinensis]
NLKANTNSPNTENSQVSFTNSPNFGNPPLKSPRIETNPINTQLLECDPGLHPQIWVCDVNQWDEIRRAYIMVGPYQPKLSEYPKSGLEKHPHESRDESKKKHMAIVLRFVDKDVTSKDGIYSLLSHNNLNIQNIRGQGYDGTSNMWGEWNGLQALILKDCPYVYYIHCLAHRLQLALVVVSHEIVLIHHCFTKLTSVVNIVGASCKRNDELKCAQAIDIEYMISIDELENGRGLNQIGTLQRHGGARWSSYFRSVSNLIKMFSATCFVLLNIIDDDTNAFQRGDANAAYEHLFINLEMMGQARHQEDNFTVAEHYRVNLFYVVIDCQLQELSSRFNEHAVQLLILSSALDPRECRESFRIGDVCQLADKFYPTDFIDIDKMNLKIQLEHYEYYSQRLVSTRKGTIFPIVYRIIVLVLTLSVSTSTTE